MCCNVRALARLLKHSVTFATIKGILLALIGQGLGAFEVHSAVAEARAPGTRFGEIFVVYGPGKLSLIVGK